ncbi:cobalamin B12-binding domain-containing protein [Prauserella muralis]|uniref:Cobalamin-binding protein n=1 Tax=Prauserella muralis TaxID=588067 RepID=A0A2V4B3G0_9PSEU|nr:cobalamin-dependent protein [Prauserella muralis]PXY27928.1 cobalamin-binding protein [Prauserella muralis]TWE22290.1 methanogenic corrinoid protein MtbC1 [Prauserella muralis]
MKAALGNARTEAERHAGALWDAVRAGDEHTAHQVVARAARLLGAEGALLDVVGAVQRRVGREWAANRLSVPEEHAATAINDRVIASVVPRERRSADRGRVTVACVDGEWHALPARLLAEVLTLRGFGVDYLGAQVPAPHLVAHLHRTGPDAAALSGSIATRLPAAHATITACQAAGVPVIVGGAAFGPDGRYARLLGADGWAPDARAAADVLSEPLARPRPGRQAVDDLPHLADHEHARVSRSSPQLVSAVYAGLEERLPVLRELPDLQRRHTAEDLAHIVGFLATALYLDDGELFTGFVAWTAEILTARGVPAGWLRLGLELLRGEMPDLPRSCRIVGEAIWHLDRRPSADM